MSLITQRKAIEQSHDSFQANLTRPTGLYGIDTGHHDWNLSLGGFIPSTITTLGAKSRHGKTATLLQVAEATSEIVDGRRGELIFFTWEMSAKMFIDRWVAHHCGLTMMQFRYAKALPEETRNKILKAYSHAKDFPITYHQTSTDIDSVISILNTERQRIANQQIEQGIKILPIVVIDYVSMAKARPKSYGSKTYDIGDFMQTFKQYINHTGMAGLFLAQIRRDVEGEPDISNLQDSGTYEQNSDNVIIMYRPEADLVREIRDPETDQLVPSTDRLMWRFQKLRENEPRDVLAHCDMKYFRFWNRSQQWGYDYRKLYKDEDFWKSV